MIEGLTKAKMTIRDADDDEILMSVVCQAINTEFLADLMTTCFAGVAENCIPHDQLSCGGSEESHQVFELLEKILGGESKGKTLTFKTLTIQIEVLD